MTGIFINRSDWEKFSESEMDEYRESVFAYYRAHGFPYFRTDDDWRRDEFRKFMEFDDSDVISGDEIRQTMHGLSLCWSSCHMRIPCSATASCRRMKPSWMTTRFAP